MRYGAMVPIGNYIPLLIKVHPLKLFDTPTPSATGGVKEFLHVTPILSIRYPQLSEATAKA